MILLSLDFETTGVDTVNDHPTEFGGVLYSTTQHKCLDNLGVLLITDREITPQITRLTGITRAALERFGYQPREVLPLIIDMIEQSDAVIGYNCRSFDRKILEAWAYREDLLIPDKPWIDLYYDMPWQVPTGKLTHVAADHGILNLFPHSALADAQTTLAVAAKYDDQLLLARSLSKVIVLQSQQARHANELVKQAPFKFRWNGNEKIWWKPVKEQDVDEVIQQAPFPIIMTGWTPEELDS